MSPSMNASGLTPEETKKPKSDEQAILGNLRDMYTSSAKDSSFSEFTQNAVFHDPVGIADGIKHIREQFFGLAKLFEKSTLDRFDVLESPSSLPSNKFLINQDVTYYRDAKKSPTKTVNSLLTIERDSNGKIVRLNEDWDHKGTSTGEDGFFGLLNEWRKKGTVAATGAFLPS